MRLRVFRAVVTVFLCLFAGDAAAFTKHFSVRIGFFDPYKSMVEASSIMLGGVEDNFDICLWKDREKTCCTPKEDAACGIII